MVKLQKTIEKENSLLKNSKGEKRDYFQRSHSQTESWLVDSNNTRRYFNYLFSGMKGNKCQPRITSPMKISFKNIEAISFEQNKKYKKIKALGYSLQYYL